MRFAALLVNLCVCQYVRNLPFDQIDVNSDLFEEGQFINDVVNRRIANAYDLNLGVTATPLVGVNLHSKSPRTGVRSPIQDNEGGDRYRNLGADYPYRRPGRRRLTSHQRRMRDEVYRWLNNGATNTSANVKRITDDLATLASQLDEGHLNTPYGDVSVPLGNILAQNIRVLSESIQNQQLPIAKQSWKELRRAIGKPILPTVQNEKNSHANVFTNSNPSGLAVASSKEGVVRRDLVSKDETQGTRNRPVGDKTRRGIRNTIDSETRRNIIPQSSVSEPRNTDSSVGVDTSEFQAPITPSIDSASFTASKGIEKKISVSPENLVREETGSESENITSRSNSKGFLAVRDEPSGKVFMSTTSDTLPWVPLDGIVGSLPGFLVDRMGKTGELFGKIVGYWKNASAEIDKVAGGVFKPLLARLEETETTEDYTGIHGLVSNKNVPEEDVFVNDQVVTGAGMPSRALSIMNSVRRKFLEFPEIPHPYFAPLSSQRENQLPVANTGDDGTITGRQHSEDATESTEPSSDYFVVGSKHRSDDEEDAAYRAFVRPRKGHPWVAKVPVDLVISDNQVSGHAAPSRKSIKGVVKQLRMPRWGDGALYGEGYGEWPMEDLYDEDGFLTDPWGLQETVAGYSYKRFRRRWDGSLISDEWDDDAVDTPMDNSHLERNRIVVDPKEEPEDFPLDEFFSGMNELDRDTGFDLTVPPKNKIEDSPRTTNLLSLNRDPPRSALQTNNIVSQLISNFFEGRRRVIEPATPLESVPKSQNDQLYAQVVDSIDRQKRYLDEYLRQMARLYDQKDPFQLQKDDEQLQRDMDKAKLRAEIHRVIEEEINASRYDTNRNITDDTFDEEESGMHESTAPIEVVRDIVDRLLTGFARGERIDAPIRQLIEDTVELADEDLPRPKISLHGVVPEMIDMLSKGASGKTILDDNREWILFQNADEPKQIVQIKNSTSESKDDPKNFTEVDWSDVATEWSEIRSKLMDKIASSVEDVTKSVNESPFADIVQSFIESLVVSPTSETDTSTEMNGTYKERVTQNTAKVLRQISRNVINSGPKFKPSATTLVIAQPTLELDKKSHIYDESLHNNNHRWW